MHGQAINDNYYFINMKHWICLISKVQLVKPGQSVLSTWDPLCCQTTQPPAVRQEHVIISPRVCLLFHLWQHTKCHKKTLREHFRARVLQQPPHWGSGAGSSQRTEVAFPRPVETLTPSVILPSHHPQHMSPSPPIPHFLLIKSHSYKENMISF